MKLTLANLEKMIDEEEKGYLEYMNLAANAETLGLPRSVVRTIKNIANDEFRHAFDLESIHVRLTHLQEGRGRR